MTILLSLLLSLLIIDGSGVASFVIYIFYGAKFEEHRLNISSNILHSLFYCFSHTFYDVIIFHICIISTKSSVIVFKAKEDNYSTFLSSKLKQTFSTLFSL